MSRGSLLVCLSIVIAVLPYAGLPNLWLMVLLPILGLLVLVIGISLNAKKTVSHERSPSEESA